MSFQSRHIEQHETYTFVSSTIHTCIDKSTATTVTAATVTAVVKAPAGDPAADRSSITGAAGYRSCAPARMRSIDSSTSVTVSFIEWLAHETCIPVQSTGFARHWTQMHRTTSSGAQRGPTAPHQALGLLAPSANHMNAGRTTTVNQTCSSSRYRRGRSVRTRMPQPHSTGQHNACMLHSLRNLYPTR